MEIPSISIVIPVYNSQETIEQAVRSIGKDPKFQIIAMVDGSPDHSIDILKKLEVDFPNLEIYHHENIGGAKTLNRGLEKVTGDYTTFLDGDDWYTSNGLKHLQTVASQNHCPDIVIGKVVKTNSESVTSIFDQQYIKQKTMFFPNNISSLFYEKELNSLNLLIDSFYTGKIFKSGFLRKNKIWFNPKLLYADRPFITRAILRAETILTTNEVVAFWRKNLSTEGKKSITDNISNIKNYEDRILSYLDSRFQILCHPDKKLASSYIKAFDYFVNRRIFWVLKRIRKFCFNNKKFLSIGHEYLKQTTLPQRTSENLFAPIEKRLFRYITYLSYRKPLHMAEFILAPIVAPIIRRMIKKPHSAKPYKPNSLPIDSSLVVFESFFGKEYGGQPRYIYEKLLESKKFFKAVWVTNPKYCSTKLEIPGDHIQVARGSDEYFRYLARAGYWVNNIKFPVKEKPHETIYLQTWHGTPLKRLAGDIEIKAGPEVHARNAAYIESRSWDFMLAQNTFSKDIFKRAYNLTCPILDYGYPATDVLRTERQKEFKKRIHEKFRIPESKKIILYAPTWRDDMEKKKGSWEFSFSLPFDLSKMKKHFANDFSLLMRMHHLVKENFITPETKDFTIDVSGENDATELLCAADILITDYSSIFFDFAYTGKPILFFMHDLDHYISNTRGLYLDVHKELPGPVCKTEEDLFQKLSELKNGHTSYLEKYQAFQSRFLSQQKGDSADRIIDTVFKDMPELC
ncbi:MAG: CDP-glycerol:glycerophosphate glycerophosphotransferase [Bdellovibrionales bacterium]|nr:CDP-glycerol:glycerophosphate glycerophosphotransferase [Bdellovibrionales bacterium]